MREFMYVCIYMFAYTCKYVCMYVYLVLAIFRKTILILLIYYIVLRVGVGDILYAQCILPRGALSHTVIFKGGCGPLSCSGSRL